MLILTRKVGEVLMIGNDVEVTVLGVKGNQVRIGVTAPKSTCVDRAEIRKRREAGIPAPVRLTAPSPRPAPYPGFAGTVHLKERA